MSKPKEEFEIFQVYFGEGRRSNYRQMELGRDLWRGDLFKGLTLRCQLMEVKSEKRSLTSWYEYLRCQKGSIGIMGR